jgi:hypothetical protein
VSRRAIIQVIGSAPALAAATATTASAQNEAKPAYRRKVFDARQWHTVEVLCDLIMPADDRSVSATHAGVPEFIDDWLDFRKREDGNDMLASQILGGCRGSTGSRIGSSARISPRPRRPSRSNCWIASPGRRRPRGRSSLGGVLQSFSRSHGERFLFERGGHRRPALPRQQSGRRVEGVRPGGVGDHRKTARRLEYALSRIERVALSHI